VRHAVRRGSYYDSVVLMQLQRALTGLPGIADAGVVMATPANREMLRQSGLLSADVEAGEGDLLIAVQAESDAAAGEALGRVDALLQVRRGGGGPKSFRPRSLEGAVKTLPAARWVLVSVPGRYASGVAEQALDLGRHVFLYSDNVSLAEEMALKNKARDRGLLVLGPDCGTAILGGTGLGFANRVRRGSIGIVAASGTGLQLVASRIHELGGGISQAIGTGGRDLSAEVDGVTACQALDLLGRDPQTEAIMLLSKPPSPTVAARVLSAARATGKPVVVNFQGFAPPVRRLGNVRFAVSLDEAAEMAVGPHPPAPLSHRPPGLRERGEVRGLFSGGTLASEVRLALQAFLGRAGHAILDLGDDEYTVGRLHPMIDQELRLRRLRAESADPWVSTILLDVVLGDGAHADPAGELAPVIESVVSERLAVLALVVGTDQDPQNLAEQTATLERAGAQTFRTVGSLIEAVWNRLAPSVETGTQVSLDALEPPAVINVGLESFSESLMARGVQAVQVDWKPTAGGNEQLAGILARMKKR